MSHIEIPADDPDRAIRFYRELFDWKIEKIPDQNEYWNINSFNIYGEKSYQGGLTRRRHPKHFMNNYFHVNSIDEKIGIIEKMGGKILVPKTSVPGKGYFAVCMDPENNDFSIWENNKDAA